MSTIGNTSVFKLTLLFRISLILHYFFVPVVIFIMSSYMVYGDGPGLKMLFLQRTFASAYSGLQGAILTCNYFNSVWWVSLLWGQCKFEPQTHMGVVLWLQILRRNYLLISFVVFPPRGSRYEQVFFVGPLNQHESLELEVHVIGGCILWSSDFCVNTHSVLGWLFFFVCGRCDYSFYVWDISPWVQQGILSLL